MAHTSYLKGYVSLMTLDCNDFQKVGRVEKEREITNNVIDPAALAKYVMLTNSIRNPKSSQSLHFTILNVLVMTV